MANLVLLTVNQNLLQQISNIPSIQSISCVGFSSYLIDFDGNLWSFGQNIYGQLGFVSTSKKHPVPTKVESLKDIRQVSYGPGGKHFLAKDSQNKIFVTGLNRDGQLGTGNTTTLSIPTEINEEYFSIWGNGKNTRAKSARK